MTGDSELTKRLDIFAYFVSQEMIFLQVENDLIANEAFLAHFIRKVESINVVEVNQLSFVAENNSVVRGIESPLAVFVNISQQNFVDSKKVLKKLVNYIIDLTRGKTLPKSYVIKRS